VDSEINIVKKKIRKNMIRIALVYPSTYEASLSSLAVHMIYYLVNTYPEIYMERFIYTDKDVKSIETGSPLRDFDYIIGSIHYELDYIYFINILFRGGIEIFREKRKGKPLIFVGGPAPMSNPAPLSDVVDAILVGEIEVLIPRLIEILLDYHRDPNRILERMDEDGFLVIKDKKITKRIWTKDLNQAFYPFRQIQSTNKEPVYGRGLIVESARGCPFWCRFCLEGKLFKPYRIRLFSNLKKIIDKGLRLNKLNRIIFYSLYFLGNPNEKKILEYIIDEGLKASIPSIRTDLLDDENLDLIWGIGQRMITTAPENISLYGERMLCKCHKISDLATILKKAIKRGFDLKLYFILGIKGESMNSVRENILFIKTLAKYARSFGRKISITINPLIPKPKTVFQWIGMIDLEKARRIIKIVRNELGGLVETRPYYVNWAWVQASIALGDWEVSRLLVEWGLMGGGLGNWRRIVKEHGYSTKYVFNGWEYGKTLPWDYIVIGEYVEDVLEKEYIVMRKLLSFTSS